MGLGRVGLLEVLLGGILGACGLGLDFEFLGRFGLGTQGVEYRWVVVKIMAPFWVP